MSLINPAQVLASLVFSILGIVVFAVGFWVIDLLTPYKLWREIVENKNVALAVMIGSMSIAIGLIVASAIHG